MKKTTKQILTASVAGTLTLMGATPPKGSAEETITPAAPQVTKRGVVAMKGELSKENGKYYLTDEASNTKVEVSGKDLDRFVGKKVTVNGTVKAGTAAAPALLAVTKIASAAAATVATTAATTAAATAVTTGVSTAAIAGGTAAAAAGTVGGLYAAGTLTDEKSASRP